MTEAVKRHYDNSRRQAQARATRRKVIEAAQRLFTEHGYPATTIEAIAEAADVSLPTLLPAVRLKRALLAAGLDTSSAATTSPSRSPTGPPGAPPGPSPTRRKWSRRSPASCASSWTGPQPSSTSWRQPPRSTPTRPRCWPTPPATSSRPARIAAALDASRALDPDLDGSEATDFVYALLSPDVHRILTVERGWPADRRQTGQTPDARRGSRVAGSNPAVPTGFSNAYTLSWERNRPSGNDHGGAAGPAGHRAQGRSAH